MYGWGDKVDLDAAQRYTDRAKEEGDERNLTPAITARKMIKQIFPYY